MVETDKIIENSCDDELITKQRSLAGRRLNEAKENTAAIPNTEPQKSHVINLKCAIFFCCCCCNKIDFCAKHSIYFFSIQHVVA